MNQPPSPGDGAPLHQAAQQSEATSTPAEIDARIRELEKTKQELEAQLAEAKSTTEETTAANAPKTETQKTQSDQASLKKPAVVTVVAAPIAVAGQSTTAADDGQPAEVAERSFGVRQLPAWAISMMVHLALLLVLGLITLAAPSMADFAIIVVIEDGEEPLEQLAEIDLSVDLENMEDLAPSFESLSISESEISELTLADIAADVSDIGPQAIDQDSISQINAIFSENGAPMESLNDRVGKMTASFFGSKAKGQRFVFVVDNSNSMAQRGRFHTAVNELVKTVEQMEADQYFYVIFFSDTAYPLFWPTPVRQLVPATPKNKERLQRWLYTVELCLHTRGSNAMKMALSLRPDAIYVLGDGAFTDNTTNQLTVPHNRPTPIFTLGMEVPQKGKVQLAQIAKANHGTYRVVSLPPAAAVAAARAPMKKNTTRGPIWGRNLPLKKKKN